MRSFIPWCFVLALVLSAPVTASAAMDVAVSIGNAPPPPVIVFRSEPRWVVLPTGDVSYYDGPGAYDYLRYGSRYYIYNNGYWYRAPSFRGPFVVIREAYVPRAFYGLHDRGYHWRHAWKNVPPGQFRRVERRHDRREDRREHGEHGQHGRHGGHGEHGQHGGDHEHHDKD